MPVATGIPTGVPVGSPVMLPFEPAPQRQGTDGVAIAGFVLSFVGFIFPFGVLAVILSAVGLSRIKRHGGAGRRRAIAGMLICGVWFVLLVVLGILGFMSDRAGMSVERSPMTGQVTARSLVPYSQLRPGDCLLSWGESLSYSRAVVPCGEAHQAQIVTFLQLDDGPYPGLGATETTARRMCHSAIPASAVDQVRVSQGVPGRLRRGFSHPTEADWNRGARGVMCVVNADGQVLTDDLTDDLVAAMTP